jgi:hypothetical protein
MMEKLTREQYRERAAAKVAAAQEVLATEVASLVTGEDWRKFLDFQAKLHDYSANNVMLIFAQHARAYEEGRVPGPTPTYIAGFEAWRALGRILIRTGISGPWVCPQIPRPGLQRCPTPACFVRGHPSGTLCLAAHKSAGLVTQPTISPVSSSHIGQDSSRT